MMAPILIFWACFLIQSYYWHYKTSLSCVKKKLKYTFYEKVGFPSVVNGVAPECISTLASQIVTMALLIPMLRDARFLQILVELFNVKGETYVNCCCSGAICKSNLQYFSTISEALKYLTPHNYSKHDTVMVGNLNKYFSSEGDTRCTAVTYAQTHSHAVTQFGSDE